ncbi:hypothetical protein GCM10009760_17160 [Kitasatospora kazusensis]|uniref:Uncharacterized protein n=1 Tax=Kitasatospora kazusensis TaxID=407974 RepID=A0ABN2Z5J9_9ACTN
MTSRNRLTVVVAVVLCAIVAVAAYALLGSAKSSPSAARSATASAGKSGGVPKPSAPAKQSTPAKPAGGWVPNNPGLADVCRTKLPTQARDTLALIDKGGPYPYRSDGIVFENRESRLPKQATGYYHEFTVVTPGSGDRGTRRVVTGTAGEEYWTDDHYSSFQEIDSRC